MKSHVLTSWVEEGVSGFHQRLRLMQSHPNAEYMEALIFNAKMKLYLASRG